LELQGDDIILGVNWFSKHNPVTFDFLGRQLTISVQGTPVTFQDHLMPKDKLFISSDQCSKLVAQGEGYMLIPDSNISQHLSTDTHSSTSSGVRQLLQQFTDIFQKPVGMSPHRDYDHSIPTIPGAKPPDLRPYRMSHSQKNSIETLIQEMLKNAEIRPSKIPFSSPVILVRKKDKSWGKTT
jgi:hypothetical protein